MRVDVLDWHTISESFRDEIERDLLWLCRKREIGQHKVDKSSRVA